MFYRKLTIIFTCCFLAACDGIEQSAEVDAIEQTEVTAPQETVVHINECPVYESRHWHAWIDRYSSTEGTNRLNITGQIDLPTPGYTINWKTGIQDRAMPPSQRFILELIPPDGMAMQMISPTNVSFKTETPLLEFREVLIYCGDKLLATMPYVTPTE